MGNWFGRMSVSIVSLPFDFCRKWLAKSGECILRLGHIWSKIFYLFIYKVRIYKIYSIYLIILGSVSSLLCV